MNVNNNFLAEAYKSAFAARGMDVSNMLPKVVEPRALVLNPRYEHYTSRYQKKENEKMSTKQKLNVYVDVPQGYELTGEFRQPKRGENFLLDSIAACATSHKGAYPILRKVWEAASWMPKGSYLYKEIYGTWFFSKSCPTPRYDGSYRSTGEEANAVMLASLYGKTFVAPTHSNCIQVPA